MWYLAVFSMTGPIFGFVCKTVQSFSKVGHRAPCRGERALNKDTSSAPAAGLGVMVKKEEETNSTN